MCRSISSHFWVLDGTHFLPLSAEEAFVRKFEAEVVRT